MSLDLQDKRYVVGIDLGTTNSAVSFVDLVAAAESKPRIHTFKIPQSTGVGEISRLSVLPSFLYTPGAYDLPPKAVELPWGGSDDHFVGAFARDHGAEIPARLVASAKSWLCHGQVDRRAKILPWGTGDDIRKFSPVQATAAYLNHIRQAWNHAQKGDDDRYLENQLVVLTVPASFDEVARELTIEAARTAGLPHVTLLEEPVAVFYSWLNRHENDWSERVRPNELILVCDVGGGTTDFTLIALAEAEGSPRFERLAVGNHLILGGDNMDLALARAVEHQMSPNGSILSSDQWKTLVHQGRSAKEAILNGDSEQFPITLVGKGSKLIAGTLRSTLAGTTVNQIILDGFFPMVDAEPTGQASSREGITEFGLPYEPEPAITRHMGWFLDRHAQTVRQKLKRDVHAPDFILFNGGALIPTVIQKRLQAAVRRWFNLGGEDRPRILNNPVPELAVALGAAYYGLVKAGIGVRVGTGSARSYYIGIDRSKSGRDAHADQQAICLVERGMEEGTQIQLPERQFEVLANQPVSFDLYSSSFRSDARTGQIITVDDSLTALPPLKTVVDYGRKGTQTRIPVALEAAYTEMGTLALWCRSNVSGHRWQLQFHLRENSTPGEVAEQMILEASVIEAALSDIRRAFEKNGDSRLLETLVKTIAADVQLEKNRWPLGFIRQLSDDLFEQMKQRSSTPVSESRWFNLMGFCLRPGFGAGFDAQRVRRLFALYNQGPVFAKKASVRAEWWIMWRRVAGGLKAGQQRSIVQGLTSVMMPPKGAKPKVPAQEKVEIWMAVANMERLGVKDKIRWARQLLDDIQPKKTKIPLFWSLARLGARELLYGPADCVVPPEVVSGWIDTLLARDWPNPRPLQTALVQMGRLTGDRMRDLDQAVRNRTLDWMAGHDTPASKMRCLEEVVPLDRQEETQIFGESLPSGLVLKQET